MLIITKRSNYESIADALRARLKTDRTFLPEEMADAIMSIITTGGTRVIAGGGEVMVATEVACFAPEMGRATAISMLGEIPYTFETTATWRK